MPRILPSLAGVRERRGGVLVGTGQVSHGSLGLGVLSLLPPPPFLSLFALCAQTSSVNKNCDDGRHRGVSMPIAMHCTGRADGAVPLDAAGAERKEACAMRCLPAHTLGMTLQDACL